MLGQPFFSLNGRAMVKLGAARGWINFVDYRGAELSDPKELLVREALVRHGLAAGLPTQRSSASAPSPSIDDPAGGLNAAPNKRPRSGVVGTTADPVGERDDARTEHS